MTNKTVTFITTGGLQFGDGELTIPHAYNAVDNIIEAGSHKYIVSITRLPDVWQPPTAPEPASDADFHNLIHPEDYIDRYGQLPFETYYGKVNAEFVRVGIINDAHASNGDNVGPAMLNYEHELCAWCENAEDYHAKSAAPEPVGGDAPLMSSDHLLKIIREHGGEYDPGYSTPELLAALKVLVNNQVVHLEERPGKWQGIIDTFIVLNQPQPEQHGPAASRLSDKQRKDFAFGYKGVWIDGKYICVKHVVRSDVAVKTALCGAKYSFDYRKPSSKRIGPRKLYDAIEDCEACKSALAQR